MTPQAWTSMVTGVNPGKHGIFDFRTQNQDTYEVNPVDASNISFPTLWDVFDYENRSVGVVNLPVSHPAPSNASFFVSGFPASMDDDILSPETIDKHLPENYRIKPVVDPNSNPSSYLASVKELTTIRTNLTISLLDDYNPELCWTVFMGADWVQHHLWEDTINGEKAVTQIYRHIDEQIGRLLGEFDYSNIFVVSDHGFNKIRGEIHLNSLLESIGELQRNNPNDDTGAISFLAENVLSQINRLPPNARSFIKMGLRKIIPESVVRRGEKGAGLTGQRYLHKRINWKKTRAFSYGSMGRMFLNQESKYPDGIISDKDYESVRNDLASNLKSVVNPETGEELFEAVTRGEEIYSGEHIGEVPDLVLTPKNWEYMIYGGFGEEWFHPPQNRDADHAPNGIFIFSGPNINKGNRNLTIYDIAPILLNLHGLPLINGMDGKPQTGILNKPVESREPIDPNQIERDHFSPGTVNQKTGPDDAVEDRLEDLGYL